MKQMQRFSAKKRALSLVLAFFICGAFFSFSGFAMETEEDDVVAEEYVADAAGDSAETAAEDTADDRNSPGQKDELIAETDRTAEEALSFDPAYTDMDQGGMLVWEEGEWHYYNENGVFDQTKTGFVDYGGGRFYVVNGVLASACNGLTLIDGVWYFLSQGQLQEVTQWAEYDGYWFYITKGILDTEKNGLMEYNGGQFLAAAGQMKKDVNGLWQNEKIIGGDGGWVFLANGQVQTQYTGLAQYDGAWFYLAGGRLAEDYTGYVEYDGETFFVRNGQLEDGHEEEEPVSKSFDRDGVTYETMDHNTVRVKSYHGVSASVVIPETVDGFTVAEIGPGAFEGNQTLQSIDLPDSITVIGSSAFKNCTNLRTMT